MSSASPFLQVRLRAGAPPDVTGSPTQRLGQVDLPECLRTGQEIFGEWHWDGGRVVVRSCRFGFFPLYYYATDDEFAVSNSIERLIECGAPAELDEMALATFLRLGWHVGDDTVFRSIRMVPPDGEVRWAGGSIEVSGGYRFPRQQHLSRSAAIDGYGELFREAVRRRASKDVRCGLPLSGGRDSRHILLELNALGCRPSACYTTHSFPPYRQGNIRVAAMLCHRLGVAHRVVGQPGSRLAVEVRKNRRTSYGALEHAWAVGLYREISRSTSVTYDGLAGDALSADGYLNKEHAALYEQGRITELAENLVKSWSWRTGEDALARVLSADATRRFRKELAVERVARELSRHTSAVIPLSSFNFWNRTRRCGALLPFAIQQQAGITAATPYLDHDLFDFLGSFPAEMYMDKTFHTEAIHRMHPGLRDIPFDDDNTSPPKDSQWHHRRFLAEASAYLALRGSGKLVDRGTTARRLLSLAISAGGNLHRRMNWIAPLHVVCLTQLEALLSSARAP